MIEKNYNHLSIEEKIRQKWVLEQTYAPENNPGPLFSVDTPPPTVSGSLHLGHVFSYTQADIVNRYKRMQGFSVFYPMGFDDNGLATERFVEKKLKIRGQDLTRAEFIELCLHETKLAEESFQALWERLGLSVNWNYCYSTISPLARKIAQASFIKLYQAGHVYRKQEPSLYCTTCQTSVAQAELDDQEVPSIFNNIKFTLASNSQVTTNSTNNLSELIIATTRPELLPSCVALFYHPEDSRYLHLENQQALVPVFNYSVPILADPLVNPEKGTGLVMCCTFGDKNDIEWYKRFKLPYKQSIGLNGRWLETTGPLAGLKAHDARTKILEILKEQNLVLSQTPISHSVNTHERCKKEIEYVVLSQWFINILDHKTKFLELADQINWYPKFMQVRYRDWVENLSWDWCISRQRFYGIPFPVWHCQDCHEILLPEISNLPVDPQATNYNSNHNSNNNILSTCNKCHSTNIKPDTDVMDTWNTSSLTPQICYSLWAQNSTQTSVNQIFDPKFTKNFLPMSLRPQAHDIIRTWAFDTIVKSYFHFGQIPWQNIMISGHVLSSDKEKLSKSKENSKTTPEALLTQYSADTVRYWTASGNLGGDIAFSENQLRIGGRLVTKLWNAFRFCDEHLSIDFVPNTQVEFTQQAPNFDLVNQWILHQASETFTTYQNYLDKYEFGLALNAVERFFWADFCDNYLELIKNQLFNPQDYTPETVQATKNTLYQVGLRILQLYAPYLPYVTEELYLNIYAKHLESSSIHQTRFSLIQVKFNFADSAQLMDQINNLIAQVRKLKSSHQLSLKTGLTEIVISCDNSQVAQIKPHEQLIRGITQATKISYTTEKFSAPNLIPTDNSWSAQLIFDYHEQV
jgi:valyl-tRNA synthetase